MNLFQSLSDYEEFASSYSRNRKVAKWLTIFLCDFRRCSTVGDHAHRTVEKLADGQFPPGPKIQAAVEFMEQGGTVVGK